MSALALLIAGGVLIGGYFLASGRGDQIEGQQDRIVALEGQMSAAGVVVGRLDKQLRDSGQTPVATLPSLPPASVPAVRGERGSDGRDGRDGTNGQSPPCLTEPSRCVGSSGANGVDGRDGADGDTPPCMSTPSQCQGANGTDGKPGPTCSEGYEPRPARVQATDGGTWTDAVVCVRPDSSAAPTTSPTTTTRRGVIR
jgi:hypothetical protein